MPPILVDQDEYSRWTDDEQQRLDDATSLSQYLGDVVDRTDPMAYDRLQLNLTRSLVQRIPWADRLFPNRELSADSIVGFQALKTLELRNCGLERLCLPTLPVLKKLVVCYNRLTTLCGIGPIDTLQILNVSYNQLGFARPDTTATEFEAVAAERDALKSLPNLKSLTLEQNCELCVGTLSDALVALPLSDLNICGTKDELGSHGQLAAGFRSHGNTRIKIKVNHRSPASTAEALASISSPINADEQMEYERASMSQHYEHRLAQLKQESAQLASQLDEAARTAEMLQAQRDEAASSLEVEAAKRDSIERDAARKEAKLQSATLQHDAMLRQQRDAEQAAAQAEATLAKLECAEAECAEATRQVRQARQQAARDKHKADEAQQAACIAQEQADKALADVAKEKAELQRIERQVVAVPKYWKNERPEAPVEIRGTRYMVKIIQDQMEASNTNAHQQFRCGCGARNAKVTAVQRVENMGLWRNYQNFKLGLQQRLKQHPNAIEQLQPLVASMLPASRILDTTINEFWLWHGTTHEAADILARTGFDERMANLGGLYGAGSYFADAMCKSNQYASQSNDQGEFCMLYCRVTMGAAYRTTTEHTQQRRPPLNRDDPRGAGATFDSIFAQSGVGRQGRQVHNEFVCFRDYQIYPEFIFRFTR